MNDEISTERAYYFRYNPLYIGILSSIFWFLVGTVCLLCAYLIPAEGIENYQEDMLLFSSFFSR